MAIRAATMKDKGQITVPVEFRKNFHLHAGSRLIFEDRGDYIAVIPADKLVDPSAGALAEYAYTRNPDPAEERRWVAQHIVETADADG